MIMRRSNHVFGEDKYQHFRSVKQLSEVRAQSSWFTLVKVKIFRVDRIE